MISHTHKFSHTHYSGNSFIWISPMEVCRVTSELSLELLAPDCWEEYVYMSLTCAMSTCVAAICSSLEGFSLNTSLSLSVLQRNAHEEFSVTHYVLFAVLRFSPAEDIEPVLSVGCTEEGWI